MKRKVSWIGGFLSLIFVFAIAWAAPAVYERYVKSGTQIYNLNDDGSLTLAGGITASSTTITGDGVTVGTQTVTSGKISMGVAGTILSTATTTGNSLGQFFTAYLAGSVASLEGSLLCSTTAVSGQGMAVLVCPANSGLTQWIGVAKTAVSTGSAVQVYYDGVVLALTSGTVNAGDILVSTSAAAGYLFSITSPTSGTDVAVAATAGNGTGLTRVRLR